MEFVDYYKVLGVPKTASEADINMEDIEALQHMLHKMKTLQENIRNLEEQLRLYEDNFKTKF